MCNTNISKSFDTEHGGFSKADSFHAEIERLFEPYQSTSAPGCAVAVIKEGQIIYKRGYGMADLEHDVPIQPNSVFHVASISKQFTATAILLLMQDGKVLLDDDVRKYIPEVPDFGTPITIRHLIHHTSGLCDQWELLSLAGWRYAFDLITDQDILDVLSTQKELNFQPGEAYSYCNTGYTLLAQVVKRVSGKSYRQFTTERIFNPLGMNNTHFRDDHAEIVKNLAYGYICWEGEGEFRVSIPNFDTVGATGLVTTVEDLAKWDKNFYEPKVGGPAITQKIMVKGKLNNGEETDYSFGLAHGMYRGLPTISHGGADAGYGAYLLRFPEHHFSVACLCNLIDINASNLCKKIADICLVEELASSEQLEAANATYTTYSAEQELAAFAGYYWNDENQFERRIDWQAGKLLFSFASGASYEMKPVAFNQFRLVGLPAKIEFRREKVDSPLMLAFFFDGDEQEQLLRAATEFKPTSEQLASYVGIYRSEEIEPIYRITVEDGALMLRRLRYSPARLEPKIADHFSCPFGSIHFGADLKIAFSRDLQNKITGFMINTARSRAIRFNKIKD
jgi:CubicO group peptidase (beta-lactamase class C family)